MANADQLRLMLGLPALAAEQAERAELLLDLALGVIEGEAGQPLESSTDTVLLDGPDADCDQLGDRRLVLPRWPVTAVDSVTLTDGDEVLEHAAEQGYTWSAAGVLTRRSGWPSGDQAVQVVYTAGFTELPKGLERIRLRLAVQAWGNPEGLTAESLGDHSRSFNAEALGMELSSKDVRAIGPYRARTNS